MCRKHLSVCLQCCLCNYQSYRPKDWQKHVKQQHPDQMNEWFEPVPSLEGELMEVTDMVLAWNIQLVEGSVPEDDDDDNKLPPHPYCRFGPSVTNT